MKHNGFTLLEFLIYFAIFLVIVMVNASWVAQLWPFYMQQTKKTSVLINLYTAHDVFIRDIKTAPSDRKCWKKIAPHEIIWLTGNMDVGWQVDKGALVRLEGGYDAKAMAWHHTTKSLIIPYGATALFELIGDKRIDRIFFEFASNHEKVSNEILLTNRKLPWKIKKLAQPL